MPYGWPVAGSMGSGSPSSPWSPYVARALNAISSDSPTSLSHTRSRAAMYSTVYLGVRNPHDTGLGPPATFSGSPMSSPVERITRFRYDWALAQPPSSAARAGPLLPFTLVSDFGSS